MTGGEPGRTPEASRIKIYVNGYAVSKAYAAWKLSDPGGGHADVCLLNEDGGTEHDVQVYSRYRAFGEMQDSEVNWAAIGSVGADEARQYAGLITAAAELAEMADAIAAQPQAGPAGLPG